MADPAQDLTAESDRLARRAVETGDGRYMRAAAVLADADPREYRRDWRAQAKRRRNAALRAMATQYFAALKDWPAAGEILRRFNLYADQRWTRDRHAMQCPVDIRDTLDGAIWELWSNIGTEILSQRQIHRILIT